MPVDNTVYDRLSHSWWDEDASGLVMLRTGLNPARFGYMQRILTEQLGIDPVGLEILDVGCGGGLLAEEFAALGARVTGIDPSVDSLAAARAHARQSGLAIHYQPGVGEQLPLPDASFDAVYCCDVLEHVDDVGRTVREIARVLRPGGVFLYDTINRTRRSRLLGIKLFQDWAATRCLPPDLHDWRCFIRPAELERELAAAGVDVRDRVASLRPTRWRPCGPCVPAPAARSPMASWDAGCACAKAAIPQGCTPGTPSSGRPADQRCLLLRTTHP